MNYQESNTKVYFTSDYGLFKIIDGNREIDEHRVKKIKADIELGIDILKYAPLIVFERQGRFEIIDGQHRFFTAKQLKRPVHFIIMPENRSLPEIAKLNSVSKQWKTKDFIHCYVAQGNTNYIKLQEFMTVYELSASLSIRLLSNGDPGTTPGGGGSIDVFQRGDFEVKKENEAVKLAQACLLFKDFAHWRSNTFFSAINRIMQAGKIKISDLVEKYQQNKEVLIKQPDVKSYIGILSIIYNKRRQNDVAII